MGKVIKPKEVLIKINKDPYKMEKEALLGMETVSYLTPCFKTFWKTNYTKHKAK